MICITLNDLYYVEWFALCWMTYSETVPQPKWTLPFEWVPLFTAEKFNERPGLNERPPSLQTRKGTFIWKSIMSAEALIQIICKNDETRVSFSQIFFVFYNKEIYKHIL